MPKTLDITKKMILLVKKTVFLVTKMILLVKEIIFEPKEMTKLGCASVPGSISSFISTTIVL